MEGLRISDLRDPGHEESTPTETSSLGVSIVHPCESKELDNQCKIKWKKSCRPSQHRGEKPQEISPESLRIKIITRVPTRYPPIPANSRPQWIAPRKESKTAP